MRALVFNTQLKYATDYPAPHLKKGEALVRVTHAGICNTDIEITKGYMGFKGVPGHEFVGIVEKCENKELIGKRVTGEINVSCGKCSYCRNKMSSHCPERTVLGIFNRDGAFAEYTSLPACNLHIIPDSVSDDEAVFVEPLAAAFEILEQINITASHKVSVLGDGKLGLLAAQVLSLTGCNLTVVGKHAEKLSILDEADIKTRLESRFNDSEFDIVVDCTGSRTGIETALNVVRPGGTVVMKTTIAKKGNVDLNRVVVNEITLIGSRCGPFLPAIEAIKSRDIDLYPMISNRFKLEDGEKAFAYAAKKGALKVILEIS